MFGVKEKVYIKFLLKNWNMLKYSLICFVMCNINYDLIFILILLIIINKDVKYFNFIYCWIGFLWFKRKNFIWLLINDYMFWVIKLI